MTGSDLMRAFASLILTALGVFATIVLGALIFFHLLAPIKRILESVL